MKPVLALALLATLITVTPVAGQERGAAALGSLVSGLSVSGRVLVIGAHPDDEDAQVITWLSRARHVETAYLSLTRGDGGQNLIGNELGEALGAIRTEELLAARRVDGGKQYFTRAYDFGFSRSADETFRHWPHDSLLRDVITVVRAFRPHVIVSVFTGTPRDGHGHHQAAGIVAREAYELSADTVRFPRATTGALGGWTVAKLYRGATFRSDSATLRINVGEYDPMLGRSYAELAAISRSQHRSQGFGTLERKGVRYDFLQREATRAPAPADPRAERTIFDGIDTTWTRFRPLLGDAASRAVLDSLLAAFAEARRRFDPYAPEHLIPALARARRLMERLCFPDAADSPCFEMKLDSVHRLRPHDGDLAATVTVAADRISAALATATAVAIEATAPREAWGIGDSVPVSMVVYNRGRTPVGVLGYAVTSGDSADADGSAEGTRLAPDSIWQVTRKVPMNAVSQPWWLAGRRGTGAMFSAPILGRDEASHPTAAAVTVLFEVDSAEFMVRTPVVYRYADGARGEVRRAIVGAPAVAVLLDRGLEYAPAGAPIERKVRVHLRSAAAAAQEVDVSLRVPGGLQVDSAARRVSLPGPGALRTVTFNVSGRLAPGRHQIEAVASWDGARFTEGFTPIEYDHIAPQRLYRPSTLMVEAVDVRLPAGLRVAYIPGVGDNSAPMLEQLGVPVTMLDPAALPATDLSGFGAVIVGPRAYEAHESLVLHNARLLDYVRQGGTMVVQYGQYEMAQPGIMPYPVTINRPHDRVTLEEAPVRIIDSSAAVLRTPNRITERDFDGWVQDRSLYMPRTFDERYRPVLELNDPGQPPVRGAILVAPYGRGTYVYTTLAFFRQLPNAIPGAARLFANLLAARADRSVP
jgi:LmbE family N-acetylglucosaminyl deacetylase